MHAHAAHFLREYFTATNWSLNNHYSELTLPSRNLLDFPIPPGLHFSLAHRPTPHFASSLSLSSLVPAVPLTYPPTPAPVLGHDSHVLSGQITYAVSSVGLAKHSSSRRAKGADRVLFENAVQSFTVGPLPIRPELRDEAKPTWQGGERVDRRDYMLYGRLYAPSPRLDALYVHRITSTLQSIVSLVSVPSPPAPAPLAWASEDNGASSISSSSGTAARLSEIEVKLQQDTGRWSSEYSYAVGDGMWGMRGLYNFGKAGAGIAGVSPSDEGETVLGGVEGEEEISGGLKGRWSAGGEVFFSAQERSAGVSTGLRFSTLPESTTTLTTTPPQPPTTITATLNPIMGHLSTAYSVAISPDSALSSRFDFNLFSYDADLTVGGEWIQRRKSKAKILDTKPDWSDAAEPSTASWDAFGRGAAVELDKRARVAERVENEGEAMGMIKFRASTNTDLALLWEGRLGDFLVSLGVVADLRLAGKTNGRISPIRSVGVGIQYWG